MPKISVEVQQEVIDFMNRYHISNVNLVQAGYDFLKVVHGERTIPDKDAVMKVSLAMYGHYDKKEKLREEARLYGIELAPVPNKKE